MLTRKPARLRQGDLIGLVSPASPPLARERIDGSVRYLERLGYRVIVGRHADARHGYLAGRDEDRAGDFNAMARQKEVRAIFALRGGYGSPRILPLLDYAALRRDPKIVAGFSDITALQLALLRRCGLASFSGPLPGVEFWQNPDPYNEEHFWRLLTSRKRPGVLPNPPEMPLEAMNPGRAEGMLLGGNLAMTVSVLGTPYFPRTAGAILVLEDVGEYPYRADRMLTQLRNTGMARGLAAVVFGQFTNCAPRDPSAPHLTVDEVLADFAGRLKMPVLKNLAYGHVPRKLTIPLGLRARVDAGRGRVEVTEAAVV